MSLKNTVLDKNQKINNIVQSEQLKRNGRIPESSKSIRSLSKGAGFTCLRILPLLTAGFLLSGCIGETLFTAGPLQFKQSDLVTTPAKIIKLKKEKTNE
jgi:lipid-binding SYLF domain-containing protein